MTERQRDRISTAIAYSQPSAMSSVGEADKMRQALRKPVSLMDDDEYTAGAQELYDCLESVYGRELKYAD